MAKRRANGEGNIRKRKDGRWEGRYTAGHDENGKAIYKNVLGRTQAETKEKLGRAIEEAKGLDVVKSQEYNLGQWMDVWFENYAKIKVRPSSHQTYRGYIDNHIKPNIGSVPLNKVTAGFAGLVQAAIARRACRPDRSETTAQGPQCQNGAEYSPNHLLCTESCSGAEADCQQSRRRLCLAQDRTLGNENTDSRTAVLVPAGSEGKRCVRDVLCGAGNRSAAR